MSITPEQASLARELRELGFSWEAIAREIGHAKGQARQIRIAIDPEFAKKRREYENQRNRSRAEWSYGSRSQKKHTDNPPRLIVGQRDPIIDSATMAFAAGQIDAGELSRRLRFRELIA